MTLTLFGFAFKKNTSDTRSTPIAFMVDFFVRKGYYVKIHDPEATEQGFNFEMQMQGYDIGQFTNFEYCGNDMDRAV